MDLPQNVFSGDHLGVYIRLCAVDLADILNVCRTGSCIYLPSTVASANYSLCDRDPWVVVAEDTCVFFVSWWIRRNLTEFHMISVLWLRLV